MNITGGCFCGAVRYLLKVRPTLKAQCHCRACQYFSGGGPNYYMLVPPDGLEFTDGSLATYKNPDRKDAVTRQFCGTCGTHITTLRHGLNETVLKVGTLDDPSIYNHARIAIFTEDIQSFHHIPDDMPAFETLPPSRD